MKLRGSIQIYSDKDHPRIRTEGCKSGSSDDGDGVLNSRKLANSNKYVGGDIVAPATPKKKPVRGTLNKSKFTTLGDIAEQVLGGSG